MRARTLLLLLGAVSLAACGEDDVPTGANPPGDVGRVRFVNAAPGTTGATAANQAVNVRVAGTPFAVNVQYGAAAPVSPTVYYAVLAGSRNLVARRTADTSVSVVDLALDVAANTAYTVLAVRNGSATEGLVLTDDNTAPAAGQTHVRVVNASPSTPTVDVYVTAQTADITTMAPTVSALAYRSASTYTALAAGATRVRFTTPGTKIVVRDVTVGTLAAGAIRTVILLDAVAGGTPLTSLTLTDR